MKNVNLTWLYRTGKRSSKDALKVGSFPVNTLMKKSTPILMITGIDEKYMRQCHMNNLRRTTRHGRSTSMPEKNCSTITGEWRKIDFVVLILLFILSILIYTV